MKSTIYVLVDPRKKEEYRYVGKTVQKLGNRLSKHVFEAKKPDSPTYKTHWIRKLLRDDVRPQIVELEIVEAVDDCEREIYWIARLTKEGHRLTNGTRGGEVAHSGKRSHMFGKTGENTPFYGKHHSEETKKRMSESRKGENNPMYGKGDARKGEKNSFHGQKHTEETRRKISDKLKGHPAHNKGKPMSPETKQKLSDMGKLRTGSKASRYGKICSSETKNRMSEAAKRVWAQKSPDQRLLSEEAKKKMSQAQRKRWTKNL